METNSTAGLHTPQERTSTCWWHQDRDGRHKACHDTDTGDPSFVMAALVAAIPVRKAPINISTGWDIRIIFVGKGLFTVC
jgi:hypothetical protein